MKNNRKERITRLKLTLFFSGFVFAIIIIALGIVFGIIALLIHIGALELGDNIPSIKQNILNVALISLILGFITSFSTGSFSISPFNIVVNAMDSLASGNYAVRLKFKSLFAKTKIAKDFEKSFNSMAAELQKTEMLRSDFVNNFSHEFKTPIVSISGFAKLLKHGGLTPEQQKEYIEIIEEESLRLSYMATNVLSLTKIENQVILTDISLFNLSEQIRNSVLLLQSKWEKKNLELILDFDEYYVNAHEEMLKQVWINLVDNAVKFTPENGKIEIDIRKQGQIITVSVINTGEPISEEKIPLIFNKFYQGDESHTSEGNGIGLAIVKHVVNLHHGEIKVKSQNGTTCFKLILPIGA
ncbi:MAG: HAMP domain-containing histidine kinase [Oscillospiraceae bacterium]|nr:HAMP domain-containing histidine kinase [Oscillospiraceae bacterium]